MPLVATPAFILHVMPYGETSKILRLLTRDLGLQSAIARGARRKKARTGPRLDLFVAGTATLLTKGTRELNPLTEFEAAAAHAGLAHDVTRFAAASALAELALKCAPEGPHPEVFEAVHDGLSALEAADPIIADAVALAACWNLVAALGFSPTTDRCAVCGASSSGALVFSPSAGGALCQAHSDQHGPVHRLTKSDRAALGALLAGQAPDPALDAGHAAAHRRLLLAFVRHHLAEHRPLPAMAMWEQETWNATS